MKSYKKYLLLSAGYLDYTWFLKMIMACSPTLTCTENNGHPITPNFLKNNDQSYYRSLSAFKHIPKSWATSIFKTDTWDGWATKKIFERNKWSFHPKTRSFPIHIQTFFQEIETMVRFLRPKSTIIGNIGGYSCGHFHDPEMKDYVKRHNVQLVDIIADPIKRFEYILFIAQTQQSQLLQDTLDDDQYAEQRKDVEQTFKCDFNNQRMQAVFYYTYVTPIQKLWMDDIKNCPIDVIRMTQERLQKDYSRFKILIEMISGYTLDVDWPMLDQSILSARLNGTLPQQKGFTDVVIPEELKAIYDHYDWVKASYTDDIWASWTPWEQHLFHNLNKTDHLIETYKPYGYDFSFTNKPDNTSP